MQTWNNEELFLGLGRMVLSAKNYFKSMQMAIVYKKLSLLSTLPNKVKYNEQYSYRKTCVANYVEEYADSICSHTHSVALICFPKETWRHVKYSFQKASPNTGVYFNTHAPRALSGLQFSVQSSCCFGEILV